MRKLDALMAKYREDGAKLMHYQKGETPVLKITPNYYKCIPPATLSKAEVLLKNTSDCVN